MRQFSILFSKPEGDVLAASPLLAHASLHGYEGDCILGVAPEHTVHFWVLLFYMAMALMSQLEKH